MTTALSFRRAAASTALLAVALSLGACAGRTDSTGSIGPVDTRERHPIVLKDAPRSLDVFVGRAGTGLDPRQTEDVAVFAADYRRRGVGGIAIEVPTGTGRDFAAQETLGAVRSMLARSGVSQVAVRSYPVRDPGLASPLRLTYASLQAKLPHDCGQWPDDTGAFSYKTSASNEPYWNFGCSNQATLAAQVADPLDLVRSRSEGRLDTAKRLEAIKKLREGKDPSTEYRQQAPQINTAVGGGR